MTEEVETIDLLADAPSVLGIPGIPGIPSVPETPGGGADTPPPSVQPDPHLHAHDNAEILKVEEGGPIPGKVTVIPPVPAHSEEESFGPDAEAADWSRLRSGAPGKTPEKGFALYSTGSKFDGGLGTALQKSYGVTFDVAGTVSDILRQEGNQGTSYQ